MNREMTATQIMLDVEEQTFTIQWADGHRTPYPLDGLRRACPCATCQGGHANMGTLPDPALFDEPAQRSWHDVSVEPVGSYGLRFVWDDGHNDGIYTWQRLRRMCPCPACTG